LTWIETLNNEIKNGKKEEEKTNEKPSLSTAGFKM